MAKPYVLSHNVDEKERTEDVFVKKEVRFSDLMLREQLSSGLQKNEFKYLSTIQEKGIPIGRCGIDLILEAKSGTGKTIVFGIIALEMVEVYAGCQVLVLTPTREIASQIGNVLTSIGCDFEGLGVETVMGGTNLREEVQRLRLSNYQILIGSTGRVRHLIKENIIPTDAIRLLVLDEADKLMEDSFQQDINYIYSRLPPRKQVIAASATYTPVLKSFLERYMTSPSHIKPHDSSVLLGINQLTAVVPLHLNEVQQAKINFEKLINILSEVPFQQCLVFCNYQTRTRSTYNLLCKRGWPAQYLSSAQSQVERLKSLEALQSFNCKILVATDLGARGIDAANVDLVVNLDPPHDLPTYLHRIGRAGRFGSSGTSITILSEGQQQNKFSAMLQQLADQIHNVDTKTIEKTDSSVSECNQNNTILKEDINSNGIDEQKKSLMLSMNDKTNIDDFNDILESFKDIDNGVQHEKKVEIDGGVQNNLQSLKSLMCDKKGIDVESFENIMESFNKSNIEEHIDNEYIRDSNTKNTNCNLISFLMDKIASTPGGLNLDESTEKKEVDNVLEDHRKDDDFLISGSNKLIGFESVHDLTKRFATQDFSRVVDEDEFQAGCLKNNVKERNSRWKNNEKTRKNKSHAVEDNEKRQCNKSDRSRRVISVNLSRKSCNINNSEIEKYRQWRSRLSLYTQQIQQYVYINTLRELSYAQ